MRELDRRRLALSALALAPAALAGLALERPIERRLGTPATIAAGLLAGSLAMAWPTGAPAPRRRGGRRRRRPVARPRPGVRAVSGRLTQRRDARGGAVPRVHRARRRTGLSRDAALPVIAGATGLKLLRLRRRGVEPGVRRALAAGALRLVWLSARLAWLIRRLERGASLLPYAVYRSALAGMISGQAPALSTCAVAQNRETR